MPTRAQVRAHRRDLDELVRIAKNDLRLMFVGFSSPDAARDGLMASLPRLVAIYGAAAGALGADFYDDVRASDGASGRFRAFPV